MHVSTEWFLVVGSVFIAMALFGSLLTRLPLTTGIIYAIIGLLLGPFGIDLLSLNLFEHAAFLEHVTEIAVVISLFTAGLKLNLPLTDPQWRLALSLATVAMVINIALVALAAVLLLKFSIGAAILLGAILSPTDPVLASDVQISESDQRDRLRFALTAEGSLNDGSAFPFVMLGLGLMGFHELGDYGLRWIGIDLLWSIFGGILIGYLLGMIVSRAILYVRSKHKESESLDDFLTLGLIALAYGLAVAAHSYGFLAVFAAGVALRHVGKPSATLEVDQKKESKDESVDQAKEKAKDRVGEEAKEEEKLQAAVELPETVLSFNQQLERIAEAVVCIILGALVNQHIFGIWPWIFAVALLFVIRPLSVMLTVARSKTVSPFQKRYMAWLGIRGIGSIYYLMYAITHGLDKGTAEIIGAITFGTIILSIFVHGISVTPLMRIYEKRLKIYRQRLRKVSVKGEQAR